ncbi:hypothetical protein YC2023_031926 [Brassica napus]
MAEERSLEYTPTWVVAFICFIIVLLSLLAERGLHHLGKCLKRRRQDALFEALQKLKEELMLLGFISLMLTVSQAAIRHICVPRALVSNMFPCKKPLEKHHAPESSHTLSFSARHLLSTGASPDHCAAKARAGSVSICGSIASTPYLHLRASGFPRHLLCLNHGSWRSQGNIQQWKHWEDRFKKHPSQKEAAKRGHAQAHPHAHALHELFNANHEFFAMHAGGFWRRSVVISWLRSFFKQFYGSVTKSEYIALRQGFIMTHCPTNPSFNFHKYMLRTLEIDFKKVLVSMAICRGLSAAECRRMEYLLLVVFLAFDQEAVIKPSDELFWFHKPEIVLQIIHFILFQNSFEIAFFFWILFTYGIHSCIMERLGFLIPRLVMGVLVQVLCSYSTLPLYALVTQMGSKFKKGIFDDVVQSTLEVWLEDTRSKGDSTSQTRRLEIQPTTPEAFNVQVDEVNECENPQVQ